MAAALTLTFEPEVVVGGVRVAWEALALAGVLLVALLLWVGGVRSRSSVPPRWTDLGFVLGAATVGAVGCGRAVHVLDFADAYAADPVAALDLGRGSASLVGAVLGGVVAGGGACWLIGAPIGSWADAAAVPLLVAVGGGKVALVLGGAGQGASWDGAWALAFAGEGPWRSIDPATAAWPSQALEGVWALLGIPVVWLVGRRLAGGPCAGRGLLFLLAVAWWLVGRAAVAFTWRDQPVLGPLGPEGVASMVALAVVLLAIVLLWAFGARGRHDPEPTGLDRPYRGD